MKAIIPVAGIGTRLRPHTHTQPKSLIPVAGKPIIAHIVDNLQQAGITEFVFIIGYLGDKIEDYITTNYPNNTNHFVIQTTGKGIAHAIWLAKDLIENDDELFIVLGDTIFYTDLQKVFKSPYSSLGIKKVDDPRSFGVAHISDSGFIDSVVEKPLIPKSNQALIGAYYIKHGKEFREAVEFIIDNDLKTNNEFYLTDALNHMIEEGYRFTSFDVDNWFDCGKKEILIETNATLLRRFNLQPNHLKGHKNTIIIPPVYIAEGCQISNSIIGPDVSIGDNTIIDYSIIKNSIIGPYAHLEFAILEDSLIGNDAMLKGMVQSLNLGDSTEINFQ
jgi:glucose-1-phosphate thymidylyltransferase